MSRLQLPRTAWAFGLTALINAFVGGMVGLVNALAGMLADRVGRKRVLLAGWALGVPASTSLPATLGLARWRCALNVGARGRAAGAAGGLTNLKDGLVWLMLPVMMGARGFGLDEIGLVAGLYPLVWAAGLVLVGAAGQLAGLLAAALLLGLGTAMAYPTLIALVADRAAP